MEILFGMILLIVIVSAIAISSKEDPRNSTSGRWGIKAGKFCRGEFGGEKWGEKPDNKKS